MTDDLSDLAMNVGMAVGFEHAAQSLGRRVRGPLGLVAQGGIAAAEVATTGHVGKGTMLGAASSAAALVGARLVPGVGWAMLAYTGADLASQTFLGKPFGETWVGRPIDWAIDKAERGAIGVATAAFDAVGWKSASNFMTDTLKPWALGEQTPDTFVRGPRTEMTPDDWYEHPPRDYSDRRPRDTSLPHIAPEDEDILDRRQNLLALEAKAMEREILADELNIAPGGNANAIREAAMALQDRPALHEQLEKSPSRNAGVER